MSQKLRKHINSVKQIVKNKKNGSFNVTSIKANRTAQRNNLVKDGNISSKSKASYRSHTQGKPCLIILKIIWNMEASSTRNAA